MSGDRYLPRRTIGKCRDEICQVWRARSHQSIPKGITIPMGTLYNEAHLRGLQEKRYFYALLFGVPGLFVSGIISVFAAGASLGLLWIYVFGDNPWPVSTETTIAIVPILTFFISWICFLSLGYVIGTRLEDNPTINKKHILISRGLTLLFILFIVLQPWSVGKLGPKSDTVLCSEYCTRPGYSASGMRRLIPITEIAVAMITLAMKP